MGAPYAPCRWYPRTVPYKGMGSVYDEGWLDSDMTAHRDWDE